MGAMLAPPNADGREERESQMQRLERQTPEERQTRMERMEKQGLKERPRHKGEVMCQLAASLVSADRPQDAAKQYEKARDVGAAHGFSSVEREACLGLGKQRMEAGRDEDGVALLWEALAAAQHHEKAGNYVWKIPALYTLIDALFETDAIDDVEPLFERFAEVCTHRTACSEGRERVL